MHLYEEQKSKYQGVTDSKSTIKMNYGEQYLKFGSRD